ncbi:2-oxo acid dehydrogenase subunit E2 [Candidatus Purcelliella pentastirinorum]|uniref:Dihydrolipoamide acetyltransferase component of pyruvate dehydrogenase complex n=1 Tax=Candidatus Purcelliella pentastirinorum TaxID=472834 RepID=A0AAX3N940_9ENTR|nr:2-oxo acid dehydrogenase subunit E2 [Candidatus Purcelliella pentastirinorum]WDI78524.1 2-oxo acid dehydrogenase subunit E2 [Candidatus Purcelliella pentastirinorum]WDR80447.1 2-oxo acid dehydrogenase subunit E2 [Candidatus Purcelliella pentastirinorum]
MLIDIKLPNIAGVNKVDVVEILVNIGDSIKFEQIIFVVEAQKASFDITSPYNGIVKDIKVKIFDTVKVDDIMIIIDSNEDGLRSSLKTSHNILDVKYDSKISKVYDNNLKSIKTKDYFLNDFKSYATPLIRRLSRKLDIDLFSIKGSGRKGRILKSDLDNYLNIKTKFNKKKKEDNKHIKKENEFDKFGKIKFLAIGDLQKNIANKLHKTWNTIPHVTQFDEIDITELEVFRHSENKRLSFNKNFIKITPIIFLLKSIAKSLKKMPNFNSSLSSDGRFLILKKYINIGVAVNSSYGLFVPVICDVDKKNITDLSIELSNLSNKVRDNKLRKIDCQGGGFTVSSLGKLGGIFFTPIINFPEVAILGVSKILVKPLFVLDKIITRTILPFSLSYDHRVINGVDAGKFMCLIDYFMSDIRRLII